VNKVFVFKKEQKTYDFSGVPIGGHPGEHPTVLIGGLFFKGQPIVEDTREGTFDKNLTLQWIDTANTMVEKTGHPFIIQAFGRTSAAMEKHLSWLSDNFDGPIMFESTNASARQQGIKYCDETGLHERVIYNSINLSMKEEEKEALRSSKLDQAVVLGWSPRATSLPDRMKTIDDMLKVAEEIGISRVLVDPATLPVGAGYGLEYRTMIAVKAELGLPTCLGPHNAPSAWRFIRQPYLDDESIQTAAIVASTVAAQLFATDSIMFGSMVRTKEVFTAVALISNAIASAIAEANGVLGIDRPLFNPPTYE
jgi:tetrahydromethanopterin S-methyltransferase subunit H